MAELPEQILDQGFEDTESIDDDIESHLARFITPIDRVRSIAEAPPGKLQSNQREKGLSDLKVDPINFMESRVHAFYRFLGLPVVGGSSFYNPGYDPSPKNNVARDSINSKVSQKDIDAMELREQHSKLFAQMFSGQGLDATLFALTQRHIKPFNLLDSNTKTKAVDGRDILIQDLVNNLSELADSLNDAGAAFAQRMGFAPNSARHILKPFGVHPSIEFSVMPADNKICVPFLQDLRATKISSNPDVLLTRPGIEFIIRARLKDTNPDKLFLMDLQKILTQQKSPNPTFTGDINTNTLISAIEALADENDINNADLNELFSSFSSTEALVVKQLIKTLKKLIQMLHDAIIDLDKTNNKITFLPVPKPQGFEKGGSIRDSQPTTKLERDLVVLTARKLGAERDLQIDRSLGVFATSTFTNLEKTDVYSQKVSELEQEKTDAGNRGLRAIKTIELITGEASGLGLIDILAVYTALWTIKIEELLGLLDNDSFTRLYDFNVSLRSDAVMQRKNGTVTSVANALDSLEKKIGNILSFADLTYTRTFTSPAEDEGGDPT